MEVHAPDEELDSEEALDTYDRIAFLKEKVGDGEQGRVSIQRRMPDGTLANLPSLPVKTFDIDVVAERYGGGKYEVRFYKGREYLGYDSFAIDPSVKPLPVEPVSVTAKHDGDAPTWLAAVLDKMGDAIKALADKPVPVPPAPPDPMAMIEKLASTMRALAPAPPSPTSLLDQLALVEKVVGVGTSIVEARGGNGGGDSGDVYMETVGKLAEPIIDLVKARAQLEAGRVPRRIAPAPAPRNAVTAGAPPAPALPSGGQPVSWIAEVQRFMPMIVKRAARGLSAEDTAFFIMDEFSEPTLAKLAELAAQPDFAEQVGAILPTELRERGEWVLEFLSAVQDYLFGDEEGGSALDNAPETAPPVGGAAPVGGAPDAEPQKEVETTATVMG